jgi:WD40 repeat protein
LRFFDINSNKQVKAIVGHSDSVTSFAQRSNLNIFVSGGHDGSIRAWDVRTFQCIFDAAAHRRKYDEGVLSLAATDKFPLIASGKTKL